DEAFITSTLKEATPVRAIDGKPVGNGRPGPVTLRLLKAYREYAARQAAAPLVPLRVSARQQPPGHEQHDPDQHHAQHGHGAGRAEERRGRHQRHHEPRDLQDPAQDVDQPGPEAGAARATPRHRLFHPDRPNQRLTSSPGMRTVVARPWGQRLGWAVRPRSCTIAAMDSRDRAWPARTAEWQARLAASRSRAPATIQ